MRDKQLQNIIKWLKRLSATVAVGVWAYAMSIFLIEPAPFFELAPYCMGSTILIFGVLTGIFKGLEYWEQHAGSK